MATSGETTSLPLLPSRRETRRGMEFSYQTVQLLRNDYLGNGSYGMVCKAVVDELVCAAKIMHQVFFQVADQDPRMMRQFDRECDFLSGIRHPCIVQYLGKYHEPESRLPVLLMELMDESLTKFLDNSHKADITVPYHIQLNIAHDIAMALSFLHSNGIIHRDMSSNNVLLLAGSRAKVADFGMSKLIEVNPRMTPLTQCPGTLVYMPPEALRIIPRYTDKLDVFATGVLIIQIISCQFPDPSVAKRSFQDERIGIMEVPVPERERRQKDIELVAEDHPLRPIALHCLNDKEQARPTSSEVCRCLAALKEGEDYRESVSETRELPFEVRRLRTELADKREECEDLREQVNTSATMIASLQEELERAREEVRRMREENERRAMEAPSVDLSRLSLDPYPRSMPTATNMYEDVAPSDNVDQTDMMRSTSLEAQLDLEAPHPSMWYHGPVNREQACHRLINAGKPGSYLIRKSDTLHVLSFLDREDRCHHFKIVERNGRFNIGGSVWFSSLTKLVGFHSKYSSVVEKHSERLDYPVPPPLHVALPPSV